MGTLFRTPFTFALMTTGAFSRNVGKLFSELKLVTDNLLSICAIIVGEPSVHMTLVAP